VARTTTFVGPGHVAVRLTSADTAATGYVDVQVENPSPGGGGSNVKQVRIVK
jgi:hypothetical protein